MRYWKGAALSFFALLAACSPPKHAVYTSQHRDYLVNVPWAWSVVTDQEDLRFTEAVFLGAFDPDFYLGQPSFRISWHKRYATHKLRDGSLEMYADADDFISQTLRDVYGPEYQLVGVDKQGERVVVREPDDIMVAKQFRAKHFVVLSAGPAAPGARWGTGELAGAKLLINPRMHGYVVVPMASGFYVLVYPATSDGYPRYSKDFDKLVYSFKPLKDGPAGADLTQALEGKKFPK